MNQASSALCKSLREYPDERLRQTAFTRHQQIVMAEHLARISKPGGLFVDQAVTAAPGAASDVS